MITMAVCQLRQHATSSIETVGLAFSINITLDISDCGSSLCGILEKEFKVRTTVF